MFLTIETLFSDAGIVSAIINALTKRAKILSIGNSILLSAGLLLVCLRITSVMLPG